uniref:Uncharacterized protein n=1 Tax=Anguilla anguilla TaxID=7936 RepID=A0A0E9XG07_ANGAN
MMKGHHFVCPQTSRSYQIKSCITCSKKGVIYLLKCPCPKVYIGETTL